ncbi:putative cysteine-rich protein YhjQ [Deinococcus xinjiangensis]|uniref:Cysteine-rich protein YhjQ n=1 Tax=Deinococcus xinjiangensis TaxID=457454 RepID=A0ABP9VFK8_9DEIO
MTTKQPNLQHIEACIAACLACVQACEHCASACLAEEDIDMLRECIRNDHDCADICALTARLLMRGSHLYGEACRLCAEACAACATECEKHAAHHDHCRLCAEACRACEKACRELAA